VVHRLRLRCTAARADCVSKCNSDDVANCNTERIAVVVTVRSAVGVAHFFCASCDTNFVTFCQPIISTVGRAHASSNRCPIAGGRKWRRRRRLANLTTDTLAIDIVNRVANGADPERSTHHFADSGTVVV